MTNRYDLLVVNEFHPETIVQLDRKFNTHHLWGLSEADKQDLLRNLNGKCRAAATASWDCDDSVYDIDSLELISAFGVGVDGIDFSKTAQRNIKVTNTPDVLNEAVADIALALILATSRNLINADRFARSGKWRKGPFPFGIGLEGKTLGIAGLGRIGEAIASRAETFRLKIAYHNRSAKALPYAYFPTLAELAANSDILLCMLPGGKETDRVINKDVFNQLRKGGIFINVGRGSSVDEGALVNALKSGQLGSAGLDVYSSEPNIPSELTKMDNVVLLPHIGSATVETRRAMGELVIQNLEAYFAGKSLLTEFEQ